MSLNDVLMLQHEFMMIIMAMLMMIMIVLMSLLMLMRLLWTCVLSSVFTERNKKQNLALLLRNDPLRDVVEDGRGRATNVQQWRAVLQCLCQKWINRHTP